MLTETVAVPVWFAAAVNVSVPAEDTAGCTLNSALALLVTMKLSVCDDSLAGPAERFVAQFARLNAPVATLALWLAPLVNDGTSSTGFTVIERPSTSCLAPPDPV